jgi:ABC-type transporter Mla subunit MlaD
MNNPSRKLSGRLIILAIGLIVAAIFSTELVWRHHAQRLAARACFPEGTILKEGAPVFIAGVKVGYVSRLSTHPGDQNCAIESEMVLDSAYQFTIPRDSTVSAAATSSGKAQVVIHIENASEAPLEQGGLLKSVR